MCCRVVGSVRIDQRWVTDSVYSQKRGGPDRVSTDCIKDGVWFGHSLLSIIGDQKQPIHSSKYSMTFNGSVYNYKEIYTNTKSDTAAILNHFDLKGTEAIAVSLPGMKEPMPISQIPYGALTAQPLALVADSAGLNWIYDAAPDSMFAKIFSLEKAGVGGWDPVATTIVDERFAANISQKSYSGQGKIEMTSYHPDRMEYASSSSEKQLAVFSEIYYADAWKAYVDDVEVPIAKVNYVLRAIEVPAGDHKIRFEFKMKSAESAKMYGNIGSIAILLLLAFGIFIESKRKENEAEDFQAAKEANDE